MGTWTARRLAWLGAAIAVLALAILAAGCGSSNNSTSTSASSGSSSSGGGLYGGGGSTANTTASSGGGAAVVSTSSNGKLGTFLVDSKGNTLYYFEKDKQNSNKSACSGACAGVWPAYTTSGSPKASKSASASKLGSFKRSDGSTQVTYNGWPLYTYTADSGPGSTKGEDLKEFGASWYVLTPAGNKPAGE
jgi:predicted lipoprotein with Yx(FWY)xxD motif